MLRECLIDQYTIPGSILAMQLQLFRLRAAHSHNLKCVRRKLNVADDMVRINCVKGGEYRNDLELHVAEVPRSHSWVGTWIPPC